MKRERKVLITGATGMIGSLTVRRFLKDDSLCRMVLPVRNIIKAEELYSDLRPKDYQRLKFIPYLANQNGLSEQELYKSEISDIIHCACETQSKEMYAHPVETADSIVYGTKNMLELAKEKHVNSMVYLSSMEVYGNIKDSGETSGEDALGSLDLALSRSCYPMAKRMAEHYCHIYQKEYGVPVKIARLAQTFGEGVKPEDQRVYVQFARAIYERRDIVLHTYGTSIGNYCHTQDAVDAILCILKQGKDGEVYNVVNEKNTMSIREMAELVVKNFANGELKVVVDVNEEERKIYAADTGVRLSSEKLRALGWKPKRDLIQMYAEVLEAIS